MYGRGDKKFNLQQYILRIHYSPFKQHPAIETLVKAHETQQILTTLPPLTKPECFVSMISVFTVAGPSGGIVLYARRAHVGEMKQPV